MVINGVNDDELTAEDRIISNGSSSCHALALILKVLHEKVGVQARRHDHRPRLHQRPAAERHAPAATCAGAGRPPRTSFPTRSWAADGGRWSSFPSCKGKLNGMALNVPVPAGLEHRPGGRSWRSR